MSHDPTVFLRGPHFNLSLQLGAVGNDAHVAAALAALWTCPTVDGTWADADAIGVTGQQGAASEWPDTKRWCFGLLKVHAITRPLPFVAHVIREQQEPLDWPIGVLRSAWSVDNSWIIANQPWLPGLCLRLAGIADHVHQHARIVAGVMGEEASGCWRCPAYQGYSAPVHQGYPPLAVLTTEVIEARGGFVLPVELWKLLAPRSAPIVLSSGLHYAPPTQNAALTGA
jgi:hypothetical protein